LTCVKAQIRLPAILSLELLFTPGVRCCYDEAKRFPFGRIRATLLSELGDSPQKRKIVLTRRRRAGDRQQPCSWEVLE
jgi:hypothetical protein